MVQGSAFRVYGLSFVVRGVKFRVWRLRLVVRGLELRVESSRFVVQGSTFLCLELNVCGFFFFNLGFRVYDLWCGSLS